MAKKVDFLRKTAPTFTVAVSLQEEQILWYLSDLNRQAYNWGKETYEQNMGNEKDKKFLSAYDFNYKLTDLRKEDSELAQLNLASLRQTMRYLVQDHESFFGLKRNKDEAARMPKYKSWKFFCTMTWLSPKLKDGCIKLSHSISGAPKIFLPLNKFTNELLQDKELIEIRIGRVKRHINENSLFSVSIVYKIPKPEKRQTGRAIGIDLGAGILGIADNCGRGYFVKIRRPDKYWRPKIRTVEARMEKRKKGSRGYTKLVEARRKMFAKQRQQDIYFQRKLALEIVKMAGDCIYVGKEKVRMVLAKSQNNKMHYGVQNTGSMSRLLKFIKEKAEEYGVGVIEVSDDKPVLGSDNLALKKCRSAYSHLVKGLSGDVSVLPFTNKLRKISIS